jgi:hypothetical protein
MNFTGRDVTDAFARLRLARAPAVSTGPTNLPDAPLGFAQGYIVRDPDGHASLIHGATP